MFVTRYPGNSYREFLAAFHSPEKKRETMIDRIRKFGIAMGHQ